MAIPLLSKHYLFYLLAAVKLDDAVVWLWPVSDPFVSVLDQKFLNDGVRSLLIPQTNALRLPKCHFFSFTNL